MVRLLFVGYPSVSEALSPSVQANDEGQSSVLVTLQSGRPPFLQTTAVPLSRNELTPIFSTLDAILLAEPSLVPEDCRTILQSRVVLTGPATSVVAALIAEFGSFYLTTEDLSHRADELIRLRDAEALLSSIIHSTQDAISVVDKEGRGLLINPAYTRLTGYQTTDIIGQPAEFDIAEGESMHMRVLQTGRPVKNVPLKVGPKRREVIVNVAPFYVHEELRGSVGVIHDVSEITHLTEELAQANRLLRSVQAKYTFDDVIGSSPAIRLAVEQARRGAPTPATVLLRGESGTGKELFAHAIHHESQRAVRPFIRVNCAALSETLLESELFGYEEGAFTGARRGGRQGLFEEASGGTLFLDEIGELTTATQAKLLRALQEREIVRVGGVKPITVDVRVIAATHIHLEQAVAKGKFREDLYYRLNVLPIVIPPLRYRKEDIEALAIQIIQKHNQAYGRNVEHLSEAAVRQLESYDWPGNVRELENTLGRAMIHMDYRDQILEERHLPSFQSALSAETEEAAFTPDIRMSLTEQVRRMEQRVIQSTLKAVGGNKTEAARRLGISVRTLYYKLGDLEDEQS